MTTRQPPDLARVVAAIHELREDWQQRFGLRVVGVIGSLGRGEAGPDSDIDLLADRTGHPSLFDLDAMEAELSRLFDRDVDIVVRSSLAPHWRAFAENELIAA